MLKIPCPFLYNCYFFLIIFFHRQVVKRSRRFCGGRVGSVIERYRPAVVGEAKQPNATSDESTESIATRDPLGRSGRAGSYGAGGNALEGVAKGCEASSIAHTLAGGKRKGKGKSKYQAGGGIFDGHDDEEEIAGGGDAGKQNLDDGGVTAAANAIASATVTKLNCVSGLIRVLRVGSKILMFFVVLIACFFLCAFLAVGTGVARCAE